MRTTVAVLVWLGAVSGAVQAQNPLTQLGLDEPGAQSLATSLVLGRTSPSWVDGKIKTLFKAMPPSVRAMVTTGTWTWAKTYLNSAGFKAQYAQERDGMKPQPPGFEGTVDDEMKKQQEESLKSIAETRRTVLPMLPAADRPAMEAALKQQEEMVKNPEMAALMKTGLEQQRAAARNEYERRVNQWEEDYPADSRRLIAKRLREFLDVCADVDFAARTNPVNNRQVFANAEYERKPAQWKECFRAGREPTTAARQAATAWLREIQ
jgi:hypothetical protein